MGNSIVISRAGRHNSFKDFLEMKYLKDLLLRSWGKLCAVATIVIAGSSQALAEGSSNYDFTAATTELTSLKTAMTSWVTSALPIILGILGAFLVFFLVRFAIGLVKRFINGSK